jgi:hypothetical protein
MNPIKNNSKQYEIFGVGIGDTNPANSGKTKLEGIKANFIKA